MSVTLSLPVLLVIFVASAISIWIAGVKLTETADILSTYFKFGEELGGMILLAIVTNLPEIAITLSAALQHKMELAIGNILGGIALQTVVLVVLDFFGLGKKDPLTYRAASLILVLEGLMVIIVLTLVVIGNQIASSVIFWNVAPVDVLILLTWIAGIYMIGKARTNLPWQQLGVLPDSQKEIRGHSKQKKLESAQKKGKSIRMAILIFALCSLITLVAGVGLEITGNAIAKQVGMTGLIFGATILAVATSLPEIATGLTSVKMKDYQMAMSDIFGGNAFLPVLFMMATIISGRSVLPQANKSDIYLAALAILLTIVYICGLIFRPRKQILWMGVDSFIVLIIYLMGIIGLLAI